MCEQYFSIFNSITSIRSEVEYDTSPSYLPVRDKKKQKTISALYLARPFALSEYEIFKKNKKMKGKMLKQNI